jgi:5-hydroxyisourate hydrolase-like protein (transthyretin family)
VRRVWLTLCTLSAALACALLSPAAVFALGSGAISGSVEDAIGHAPLEGIEVCARQAQNLAPTACASTDAAGKYTIGGLPESTYEVRFSPPLSGPNQDYLYQYYDGKGGVGMGEGDLVAVTEGVTTPSIDAALQPAGGITGVVTGADTEAPLEGVMVCANPAKKGSSMYSTCTATKAGGVYVFPALAAGSYRVHFTGSFGGSAGYLSQYYDDEPSYKLSDPISVSAGSTTAGIDAALRLGGKITGTVVDLDGQAPIQWIEVCAARIDPGPFSTRCAQTNAAGGYAIEGLLSGSYAVSFRPGYGGIPNYLDQYYDGVPGKEEAKPVVVTLGSIYSGIDAEMAAAGKISGEVTDAVSKDPAPAVRACAIDSSGEQTNCDITDDEGKYTIPGLSPGAYKVHFAPGQEFGFLAQPNYNYVSHYYDGELDEAGADSVAVIAGATESGINTEMEEGGKISGLVTDAGDEAPVRGIEICAYKAADDEFISCGETDEDGEYTIEGLATGSYKVWFSGGYGGPEGESGYLGQYYDGEQGAAEADPVSATVGATTTGIDAQLHLGGQIEGRVVTARDGAPLRFVEVCALEAGGEEELIRCGGTNGKGEYAISGLATGSYKVKFTAGFYEEEGFIEELVTQYYSGKASAALSNTVSVTAGTVTGSIDAKMSEPGEEQPSAGGGGGSGGSAVSGSSPSDPVPPPIATPPGSKAPGPAKCKKGFAKKKTHGKIHCLKIKPRRKKH